MSFPLSVPRMWFSLAGVECVPLHILVLTDPALLCFLHLYSTEVTCVESDFVVGKVDRLQENWLQRSCLAMGDSVCVCVSCLVMSDSLRPPWTVTHQAPLSKEFSRQEYWSGLPCPSCRESSRPRDRAWVSHMQADSLLTEP